MTQELFGKTIGFNDTFINFVEIRHGYEVLADDLTDEFKKELTSSCSTLDKLIESGDKEANKYIGKAVDRSIEYLTAFKIYAVDDEMFLKELDKRDILKHWLDTFQIIKNRYETIIDDANKEMEFRKLQKECRGQFSGGGFGIEGAIKGAIQSSALNFATDVAYSLFNSIENSQTIEIMNKRKEQLYDIAMNILCDALNETIKNFYWITMDYLSEEKVMDFSYPGKENFRRANALFENLKKGRIPLEDRKKVIVDTLQENPLNEEVYEWILENIGDQQCEIEKFAEIFLIDLSKKKILLFNDFLLKDFKNFIDKHSYSINNSDIEDKLIELRSEIPILAKKFGIKDKDIIEYKQDYDETIKTFNEKNRNVKGVIFATRTEAENARDDIKLLDEYVSLYGVNPLTIKDEISNLEFKTNIISDHINEYVEELISNSNEDLLPAKVEEIFDQECFFDVETRVNANEKPVIYEWNFYYGLYIDKIDEINRIRQICEMNKDEVIAFIVGDSFEKNAPEQYFILSNCYIYNVSIVENKIQSINKIPFLEVENIYVDSKLYVHIIKKYRLSESFCSRFKGIHCQDEAAKRLTISLRKICKLLFPLIQGRDVDEIRYEKKLQLSSKVKKLDVKDCLADFNKILEKTNFKEEFRDIIKFNDESFDFNVGVKEFENFWGKKIVNEIPYLILRDCKLSSNMLFTSRNIYVMKEKIENSFVYPIEKIGKILVDETSSSNTYLMNFNGKKEKLCLDSVPKDVLVDVIGFINNMLCTMNEEVYSIIDQYAEIDNEFNRIETIEDANNFINGLKKISIDAIKEKYEILVLKRLEVLKKEARTYAGILFDDIDRRNKAEEDFNEIANLLGKDVTFLGILKLEEVLSQVQEKDYVQEIKDIYIKKISEELSRKVAEKGEVLSQKLSTLCLDNLEEYDKQVASYYEWAKQNGVKTDGLNNKLAKLREEVEKSIYGEDGYIYPNQNEAEMARAYIIDFVNRLNSTSVSDVDGLNNLLNEINNTQILSKNKYINFIKSKAVEADVLYRTVRNIEYSTKEEARIARMEDERLKKEIPLKGYSNWMEPDIFLEKLEDISTLEIKQAYTNYFEKLKNVCKCQKELVNRKVNYLSLESTGCYLILLDALLVKRKAEIFDLKVPVFHEWYTKLQEKYLNINGKLYFDIKKAYDKYIDAVEHAKAYD